MIGDLVGWAAGSLLGEGLGVLIPRRVSGWGVLASYAVAAGLLGAATWWWRADPASDVRTRVIVLSWLFLPAIPILLTFQYEGGSQERRLRREGAGAGVLRNERLRER